MKYISTTTLTMLAGVLLSTQAYAIVPVDQANVAEEGVSGNVGVSINGQAGNKDEHEYSLSSILRYGQRQDSWVLITDYNYSETNDIKDEDEFYSHLRWTRFNFFSPKVDAELFAQYEYDDFADLSSRKLAGGGARWRFANSFDNAELKTSLGTGVFYEVEKALSSSGEVDTTRANLYVKLLYSQSAQYPFDAYLTVYYQPALDELDNFRSVVISGLEFKVTKALALTLETELEHNSKPFSAVEKTDFEYGVRLSYSF
ncbi:DUF481 domain-containing protein [Alteromonas sp. ASW11-130]|uniref:DUF481 domain-containing protein n=1 Tax=Alteromonas sp. ASW11-130 TaxID=3015775 RepID=UPI002241F010|nr:DUF481 domain-containing protein [Alteromonas sp. ASW11-130]MCW8090734.1 DUF481 domain-containing protein [Alteromonas sp. ASW11-130]